MLQNLKTRTDLHISRKIFHILSILGVLICMIFLPVWICWTLFFAVAVPLILMDYFRKFFPAFNRFSLKIIGPVIRKHEVRRTSGSSYAAIGIGLSFLIFPKPICLLSVLFLAIGDPIASFFGLLFGKTKIFANKSLVGTVAAFAFCSLAAFIFISLYPKPMGVEGWGPTLGLSLACGLIGALSELMSFFSIDDNLSQPIVSGFLLSLLFWQLGGVVYG